jgi:PPPDE putative peptidase domain
MVKRSKKGEGKNRAAKVVAISCEDGQEGHASITTTYPALQWSSDSSDSSSSSSSGVGNDDDTGGSLEHHKQEPVVDEAAKVREAFRQRSLLDEQQQALMIMSMQEHRAESPIIPVMTRQASRDLLKSVAALHMAQPETSFEGTSVTLSSHNHQLRSSSHHHHHRKNSSTLDPEARTSVSGPPGGGRNFTLRERFQRLSRLQRKKLLLKQADREHQQQHAGGGAFLLLDEDADHADGDHHHDHDDHDDDAADHVETCASSTTSADDDPRADRRQQRHQQSSRHHQLQQQQHHHHSQYHYSSSSRHAAAATSSCASDDDNSQGAWRHERLANYYNCSTTTHTNSSNISSNSNMVVRPRKTSYAIKLHVYDLIARDTLMMLPPFGCIVEIGKCFNEVNSALHQLGTGAYHVGIEINGIEYAYGATSTPGKTGIFSCIPTLSPGYQYRQTIDLGERPCLVRRAWVAVPRPVPFRGYSSNVYRQVEEYIDGRQVIKEMTKDYMGTDYDILRKNCCSFARDACIRLGVQPDEIPSWFRNLAETGATTQDMALATVQPLTSVLSACEEEGQMYQIDQPEFGFEMIARQNAEGTKSIVVVVDSRPQRRSSRDQGQISLYDLRRNATWTY